MRSEISRMLGEMISESRRENSKVKNPKVDYTLQFINVI